ncbi:MAG: hypothetical protein E7605_01600 [Ruminococcaceae bacterium]|nr:hypothetical protein [Oscillospiraceae bacterium]
MKRLKQSLCWLLTLAMLFSMMAGLVVGVAAELDDPADPTLIDSGSCGEKVTYEFRDETPGDYRPSGVLTIKGVGPMTEYEQLSAMVVNTPWYDADYRYDIQKVVIMPGVTSVGSFAFFNLIKCTEVVIPIGVTSIGEWAFAHTALTKVDLPSTLKSVRHFAFFNSKLLSDGANSTCAGFPSIDNEKMGTTTTNYDLINDLDETSMNNIIVEASGLLCEGIEWRYSSVSKTLTLSSAYDGVINTTIYEMIDMEMTMSNPNPWPWYTYMPAIQNVYITKGISNIGQLVLAQLPALKSVTIGDHVKTIETNAFNGAKSLKTTITLPEATTTVEANAFLGCPGPIIVTTPHTKSEVGATFSKTGNIGVTYQFANDSGNGGNTPSGPTSAVSGLLPGGTIKWTFIPGAGMLLVEPAVANTTVSMPHFASSSDAPWDAYDDDITLIFVQAGITEIGKYNFADLPNATNVSFPEGLVRIDEHAFENNGSIASLKFPSTIAKVYQYAFDNCNGLISAVAPTFMVVDRIGNERLYNLLYGTGTTPPNPPVTHPTSGTCGFSANWEYNPVTKTLTISGSGPAESYASASEAPWSPYMDQIETLIVTETISILGSNSLNGATSLKNVTLPSTLMGIGENAFNNCPSIADAYVDQEEGNLMINLGNTDLTDHLRYKTSASAPTSGTCGAGVNWEYNPVTKILIISGQGPMTDYASGNATPWASYMTQIETVIVSDGVTSVGTNALNGATALQTVTMPASLAEIKLNAFSDCTKISYAYVDREEGTVDIRGGNTYLVLVLLYKASTPPVDPNPGQPSDPSIPGTEIGGEIPGSSLTWTYSAATHALNIKGTGAIPNYASAKAAPWSAYASDITAITVQEGITRVGNNAFGNMTSLIDVYLPQSLTSIGDNVFNGCTSIKTVKLPDGLTSMGKGVFRNCSSLKSIEIPAGIREIDDYSFCDCVALETVTLNKGLERIGYRAFYNCKSLKFIEFPSTLQEIDDEAFCGCSGLEGVVISSSPLYIGKDAFAGCKSLVKVILDDCNPPEVEEGNECLTDHYVESKASGTLSNGVQWEVDRVDGTLTFFGNGEVIREQAWLDEMMFVDTVIFDNGITGIEAGLLKDDDNVEYVRMANTVTSIGEGAFQRCENLQRVIFSKNLTSLGKNAFAGCTSLTDVALPDSLTVIPEGAFTSCTAMTAVTLGKNVTTIGKNAFDNCASLKKIEIPATVTTLSDGAFRDCVSLEKVTMYYGKLKPLNKGIFDGCSSIETVEFNGTQAQWDKLTANADEELTSAHIEFMVTVTINFVYQGGPLHGQIVAEAVKYLGKTGEHFTIVVPEISYYTPKATILDCTFGVDNQEITVEYVPNEYTVTIEYVDGNGNKLAPDGIVTLLYGEYKDIPAVTIPGHSPKLESMTVNVDHGNTTVVFEYVINQYSYLIEYRNERTGALLGSKVVSVDYMTDVQLTTADMPPFKGYTLSDPDKTYEILGIKDNSAVITVNYAPNSEKITIHYVDENGKTQHPDEIVTVYYGDKVFVESPPVPGMKPAAAVEVEIYNGEQNEFTVQYERKEYTITINFLKDNASGEAVYEALTLTAKHGDEFVFDLADYADKAPMTGYEVKSPVLTVKTVTGDCELNVIYTKRQLTLTVHYVDENGKTIAPDKTITVLYGDSVNVASPVIDGMKTAAPVEIESYTGEETEITVKYERKEYKITINFVKDSINGEKVYESLTATVKHGDKYVFDLTNFGTIFAPMTGYEVKAPVLTINSVTADGELNVVYTRYNVSLTIHYVDENGKQLLPDKVVTVQYGDKISVVSPEVEGMKLAPTVEFDAYTGDPAEYTVKYERKEYKITVNFLQDGEAIYEALTLTAKHGDKLVFDLGSYDATYAPNTGYEVKTPVLTIDSVTEDGELNVVYTLRQLSLIIHYVGENGETLAEDYLATVPYGEKVTIMSPSVTGMVPDLAAYTVNALTDDAEITVKYSRATYKITVHFKEVNTHDYSVFNDFTVMVKYGETYSFVLADHPEYINPAYTTDVATLDFGTVTGDAEQTIIYTPKSLTLTVEYKNDKGEVVTIITQTVLAGRTYNVPAKKLEGYVEAAAQTGNIGVEDKTIVVTLVAESSNPVDPDDPTKPDDPNNPDQPDDPNNPDQPDDPNNPDNPQGGDGEKGNGGTVVAVIAIIVLVLGGGGAAFYFLYKKKMF